MVQASILDQFVILYKVLINNKNIKNIIIITLISLLFLVFANIFKNKRITKIIYILIYVSIFGYLVYNYYSQILSILDYLINNIFILIFFPNLAVYILVLFIINFIVVKSSLNLKEKNIKKYFNIIFFIIFNIIFYLIINNIIENKIDVYQTLSIYTNSNLLNLIELSMKLFAIWIIILILIQVIEKICIYAMDRKQINNNLIMKTPNSVDELKLFDSKIKTKDSVLETISNSNIKKQYNYYNDYIDIEPIKKYKDNLKKAFDSSNQNSITNKNLSEIEIANDKNKIEILVENRILEKENLDSFEKNSQLYDSVFEPITINAEHEENMNNVFTKNTYLQSIILDIDKLKNNKVDKKQIKEIYDNIKINANNLSLNDYNF